MGGWDDPIGVLQGWVGGMIPLVSCKGGGWDDPIGVLQGWVGGWDDPIGVLQGLVRCGNIHW